MPLVTIPEDRCVVRYRSFTSSTARVFHLDFALDNGGMTLWSNERPDYLHLDDQKSVDDFLAGKPVRAYSGEVELLALGVKFEWERVSRMPWPDPQRAREMYIRGLNLPKTLKRT